MVIRFSSSTPKARKAGQALLQLALGQLPHGEARLPRLFVLADEPHGAGEHLLGLVEEAVAVPLRQPPAGTKSWGVSSQGWT